MNAEIMKDILQEILVLELEESSQITEVLTFLEAGVLSINQGLVLRTNDGSEFQLTIVQSK